MTPAEALRLADELEPVGQLHWRVVGALRSLAAQVEGLTIENMQLRAQRDDTRTEAER